MGLQVKVGRQRWIQQKFVRAGIVNDYWHNYSGTLYELEA
jgi:hypothetical protein